MFGFTCLNLTFQELSVEEKCPLNTFSNNFPSYLQRKLQEILKNVNNSAKNKQNNQVYQKHWKYTFIGLPKVLKFEEMPGQNYIKKTKKLPQKIR